MKYVFIVNPKSGKSEIKEELLNSLEKYKSKIEYEIYFTKEEKDATRFVNEYCKSCDEDVLFFSCGGDGTLNEVVSGAIHYSNAIVTCFPCGSGNDFVKIYGGKEKFLNLDNLLNGEEIKIDVMKVNENKYSINVKIGICLITHTLKSLIVCFSTPFDASITITAESAAISVL